MNIWLSDSKIKPLWLNLILHSDVDLCALSLINKLFKGTASSNTLTVCLHKNVQILLNKIAATFTHVFRSDQREVVSSFWTVTTGKFCLHFSLYLSYVTLQACTKKKQSKTCVTKALQLKVKQLSRACDEGDGPIEPKPPGRAAGLKANLT